MRSILRIISFVIFTASIGLWIAHGSHRGWTTTENEIRKVDEITGIEYSDYQKKLTFGIELPVAGTLAAALLLTFSIFFNQQKNSQQKPQR